jgi:hypothetical protein
LFVGGLATNGQIVEVLRWCQFTNGQVVQQVVQFVRIVDFGSNHRSGFLAIAKILAFILC